MAVCVREPNNSHDNSLMCPMQSTYSRALRTRNNFECQNKYELEIGLIKKCTLVASWMERYRAKEDT